MTYISEDVREQIEKTVKDIQKYRTVLLNVDSTSYKRITGILAPSRFVMYSGMDKRKAKEFCEEMEKACNRAVEKVRFNRHKDAFKKLAGQSAALQVMIDLDEGTEVMGFQFNGASSNPCSEIIDTYVSKW